ncbi:hypothetical protein F4827_005891 [Paraburkholderia bannensis]|uniref:Lipoprotein n=1 Tax=Paraburkholderia bannensis TaxID=765414 RepID=A0A7W9U2U9_9BURK|nr:MULTISPECIES: hypothetical protein [Paraburkholderia]MBB3260984.1 hypothetical protein [Paraburkholderia sp. WP4_3_2]MBB6106021.1 hypothetical protein [Paraburkholderia bannensis]
MTRFASLSSRKSSLRWLPFAAGACALLAALSACSSGPPLFLSDGRPTVQVQCPAGGDRDSCVQQARVRCAGAGYDTVDTSTTGDTYTLVFACKGK